MKSKLILISKNAIKLCKDKFAIIKIDTKRIGDTPASSSAIESIEKRLGILLPNDVKKIYKTANGTTKILPHIFSGFMPIKEIDW